MFFLYFGIGIKVLFVVTVIFYLIFFGFVLFWSKTKVTPIIVPLIYTFKFFLGGVMVVAIISFFLEIIPNI